MARILIDVNWSLPAISLLAGADHELAYVEGDFLNCPDVTQAALDAALLAYDDVIAKQEDSQAEEDNMEFPNVLVTIAKGLHNHENRIRVLEGRASVTLRQLVSALREL